MGVFENIYPVLEGMTWSLCQQNGIAKNRVQNILQLTVAKIDPHTLNSTEKENLITDFRRLVIEEIKQMQKQD
jgi:hypothetical protein